MSNSFRQTSGPVFKAPEVEIKTTELDNVFTDRLKFINMLHAKVHLSYYPSDYADRRYDNEELFNCQYQQAYPESTFHKLIHIRRNVIHEGQFIDENGNIKKGIKYALTFTIGCQVEDPESVRRGIRGQLLTSSDEEVSLGAIHDFKCGIIKAPTPEYKYDKSTPPRIIDARVNHYEWRYYIEDTLANRKAIISKYGNSVKTPTVGIANIVGEPLQSKLSVFSLDEWLNEPVEDLIAANKNKFFDSMDSRPGSVAKYRRWREKKKELDNRGISAADITLENKIFLESKGINLNDMVSNLKSSTIAPSEAQVNNPNANIDKIKSRNAKSKKK